MWILKYLLCLLQNHNPVNIAWQDSRYQYCLRCGKVEVQEAVKENILIEIDEIIIAN